MNTDQTIKGQSPSERKAARFIKSVWAIAALTGLLGLLAGSFSDLKISGALYHPGVFWATLFAYIGPVPLYINLAASIWLLFDPKAEPESSKARTKKTVFLVLGLLLVCVITDLSQLHLSGSLINGYVLLELLLTLAGGYLFYRCFNHPDQSRRIRAALFLIASAALCMSLVAVIKAIWSRPRFVALQALNPIEGEADLSYFQNWWQISKAHLAPGALSGLYAMDPDFFRSFVSGHTASAAACFSSLIVLLYAKRGNEQSFRITMAALCFVWTFLTALSRIILGKHFLSDVSGGLFVNVLAAFLAYLLVYRTRRKASKPKKAG